MERNRSRETPVAQKPKKLCKWKKKDIEKRFGELVNLVSEPEYVCRKCGRAAHDKDCLCRPKETR